jgi:hypothetical protein
MLLCKSNQEEGNHIRFNEHMIKYLQSDAFTAVVESSDVPEFCCPAGMCVVIQSLAMEDNDCYSSESTAK